MLDWCGVRPSRCSSRWTVGGGVRSIADVDVLLRAGADKVGVNTAAINRPELIREIAERFGNQVLVLSLDVRRSGEQPSGWEVTTHGGRRSAGSTRSPGPAGSRARRRARSCSTRWTPTHQGRLRPGAESRRCGRSSTSRSSPAGERAWWSISPGGGRGRRRVLAASVFHFGDLTSARSRTACGRPQPGALGRRRAGMLVFADRGGYVCSSRVQPESAGLAGPV